jgi:3',5'-cyclic AMP phosphodiesterase CpdA
LLILHLSDLHFGPHSRFRCDDVTELSRSFVAEVRQAALQLDISDTVGLVVVTGDLTEAARPAEWDTALTFLHAMTSEFEISKRHVVVVPGNHDISWFDCKRVIVDQEEQGIDDDELRRRLDNAKLKKFVDFQLRLYGVDELTEIADSLVHHGYMRELEVGGLDLSLAALNSCEAESHRKEDHYGCLSRAQVQAAMDRWLHDDGRLRLICLHHNPEGFPADAQSQISQDLRWDGLTQEDVDRFVSDLGGFRGKDLMQQLVSQCRVHLVLHGHQHQPSQLLWPWEGMGSATLLSAGSMGLEAGKLPGEQPASVRLILLDPFAAEPRMKAWCLRYQAWTVISGSVETGGFTPDREVYEQRLHPPKRWAAASTTGNQPQTADEGNTCSLAEFLRNYRSRLQGAHARWDPGTSAGAVAVDGRLQPIEAELDEMYVPLRLAKDYDINKTFEGIPVTIEKLLARSKPLVIRGPAGSGKTTWMRWTFRRLLRSENDIVPLLVILRDLGQYWSDHSCQGVDRSIEGFLDHQLASHMGGGWQGWASRLLTNRSGPRPVLLIDGWDELGDLGEELRTRLVGLMAENPRLLVVVSSRPYGVGRPSKGERFEVLDIQPLNDNEIGLLARRFNRRVHDAPACERQAKEFLLSLAASNEANTLARTALLLTMMLLIHRSRPLPDKRHLLYEACIESLLDSIPGRREQQGSKLTTNQWRPDDSEQRLRLVAELAFRIQNEGFKKSGRTVIPRHWHELAELLPDKWPESRRYRFLTWLAGPAGLLTDRTDGTVVFTHLSFQEYLAAWHLDATCEADRRAEAFLERLSDSDWWETLLLWAARIARYNPSRLDDVLDALGNTKDDSSLALAGMIHADGLGSEASYRSWLQRAVEALRCRWPDRIELCARAWSASSQGRRRQVLAETIDSMATGSGWQGWLRLRKIHEEAGLGCQLTLPAGVLSAAVISQLHATTAPEIASIAAGRILCGAYPLWSTNEPSLGLLHLWPGHRRIAGLRLQLFHLAGAEDILSLPRQLLEQPKKEYGDCDALVRDLARYWARDLAQDLDIKWARDLARDWAISWARYWAHYWARDLSRNLRHYWARDLARDLARYWAHYWARYWAHDWARLWSHDLARDLTLFWVRDLTRDVVRGFAQEFRLKQSETWVVDAAAVDLFSFGRITGRAFLASVKLHNPLPEEAMLAAACRLSLQPERDPVEFEQILAQHSSSVEPLWLALAGHLAGRSTTDNRDLLVDLAQHPEKLDPPLRWGLQFIVRGDVLCEDGTIVTLDQLCDHHGIDHLPYLEVMEKELEIDWHDNEGIRFDITSLDD